MDILERVRAWMREQRMLEGTETLLCALSGGADSVCLLHLLLRLSPELGFRLEAAHYHHGIRGQEADRDLDFCADLCGGLGVPLHKGRGDVPAFAAERGLSLETAARELRYAFLEAEAEGLPACRIATAHQAEDNAETLLLHLCRGAGLAGLGGIPPVRGRIVRPLLPVSREEILNYLGENGLPHVEDSTNALEEGERNILRRRVMPVLRELNPAFSRSALRAAELLREDEACLRELAEGLTEIGPQNGPPDEMRYSCETLLAAPKSLSSRALRLGAERLGCRLERKHVEALLELASGGGGLSRCDLPGPLRASREFDLLRLYLPKGDPAPFDLPLTWGEWAEIPGTGRLAYWGPVPEAGKVNEKFQIFFFKKANICGTIHVRSRRSGDTLRPAGRNAEKTLRKWMIENRIPALERDGWPVFADERGVAAVPGVGAAERVSAAPEEADGAILFWERNEDAGSKVSGNADQRGADRG